MKKFLGVVCLLIVLAMAVPSSATASATSSHRGFSLVAGAGENAPCGNYEKCGGGPCCACGRFQGGPICIYCCSDLPPK